MIKSILHNKDLVIGLGVTKTVAGITLVDYINPTINLVSGILTVVLLIIQIKKHKT